MDVFQKVCRSNLDRFKVDRVGRGTQGNIYKISVDGCAAAVKDITNKNFLYRLFFGRWLLTREIAIYERLQGLPGIPLFYKRIDDDGFIIEYVDGVPLSVFSRDALLPVGFFDALADLVDSLHRRGVVHSDLKHKKNILVGKDGQPYLIDFGASWTTASAWNLPKRWFYHQFQQIDRSALSKIRTRYANGSPGAGDEENLARRNFMEKCGTLYQWFYRFFSRKHRWKRRRRPSPTRSGKQP